MGEITTIGLDIAKHVFQVHGVDAAGRVVVQKRLRRGEVERFFARLPPTLVAAMAKGQDPGSRHSALSARRERVGMLGPRSAHPIGASGHRPRSKAGHMTAPDQANAVQTPCEKGTVHT